MLGTGPQFLLRFPGKLLFPLVFLYLDLPGMLAELLLLNDPVFRDPGSFTPLILDPERFLCLTNNLDRSSHRRSRGQVYLLLTFCHICLPRKSGCCDGAT